MTDDQLTPRLATSLLFIRIGVSLVFLMWTIDKFLNPKHTAAVFQHFYMMPELDGVVFAVIGGIQLIVVLMFLTATLKTYSYMAVFVMHLVSTVSAYANYMNPWASPNLLFFAAIPMLAGCWALWSLREYDTLFSVDAYRAKAATS